MTPRLNELWERISPEDVALAKRAWDLYALRAEGRTYAFDITSDTFANSEETGTECLKS